MPNVIKPSKFTGSPDQTPQRRSNVVRLTGDSSSLNSSGSISKIAASDTVILSTAFEKAKKIVEAANTYSANHIKETTERMNQECAETKKLTHAEAYADGFSEGKEEGQKQGYEAGRDEGYKAGLAAANEEGNALYARLAETVTSIENARKDLLTREEDNLSDLAIMIAEKVLNQAVDSNKAVMGSIISRVVTDNQKQEWIKVNVSQDVYDELEKIYFSERVQEISSGVTLSPSPDLADGDCVIEMPSCVTDASISTQLSKIKTVLKK